MTKTNTLPRLTIQRAVGRKGLFRSHTLHVGIIGLLVQVKVIVVLRACEQQTVIVFQVHADNMKCKSVIIVVLLAVTVIAAEELSIPAQKVDQNASDITSNSADVEEGRIRHHHLLPFYGGLCKVFIYYL